MARIVDVHHPDLERDLLQQALDAFYGIRADGPGPQATVAPANSSTGSPCCWPSGVDAVELDEADPVPRDPAEEGAGSRRVRRASVSGAASVLMASDTAGTRPDVPRVALPSAGPRGSGRARQEAARPRRRRWRPGCTTAARTGFYYTARSLLIHHEGHLDAFDRAFLAEYARDRPGTWRSRSELRDWLDEAAADRRRTGFPRVDAENRSKRLKREFEERLRGAEGAPRRRNVLGRHPRDRRRSATPGLHGRDPGGRSAATGRPSRSPTCSPVRRLPQRRHPGHPAAGGRLAAAAGFRARRCRTSNSTWSARSTKPPATPARSRS